jgi:hypothetical protein
MTSTLQVGDWGVWRAGSPRSVQVGEDIVVDLDGNGRVLQVTNLSGATVDYDHLLAVLADLIVDRSWGMHE